MNLLQNFSCHTRGLYKSWFFDPIPFNESPLYNAWSWYYFESESHSLISLLSSFCIFHRIHLKKQIQDTYKKLYNKKKKDDLLVA